MSAFHSDKTWGQIPLDERKWKAREMCREHCEKAGVPFSDFYYTRTAEDQWLHRLQSKHARGRAIWRKLP